MTLISCPVCNKRYPTSTIGFHVAVCMLNSTKAKQKPRQLADLLTPRYRSAPLKNALPSEIGVPGFHLFPDAFTDIDELLVSRVLSAPPAWIDYCFKKGKNYGPSYNLRNKRFLFGTSAPKEIPLPAYAIELVLPRLSPLHPQLKSFQPNQLAVSEYPFPGGHILPHNDCENGIIGMGVVGVCLKSACTMTFILRARYSGTGKDIKKGIILPAGAAYFMSNDALRIWEHAIFPGKTESMRYSLTFRDVTPFPSTHAATSSCPKKGIAKKKRFSQSRLS